MNELINAVARGVLLGVLSIAAVGSVLVFILLSGCHKGLPHRPINELTNWGQGRAPSENHCPPGTLRFETDDGFFLECFRTGGTGK